MNTAPLTEPVRKRPLLPLLMFCLLVFAASCRNQPSGRDKSGTGEATTHGTASEHFDAEAFSEQLASVLPPVDTTDSLVRKQKIPSVYTALHNSYQQHEYMPFWIGEDGQAPAAEALIRELDTLKWDGLNTAGYPITDLREQLKTLDHADIPALIDFDTSCTNAYLKASRELLFGALLPRRADSLWFHSNDSLWQAPRLLVEVLGKEGQYPSLDSFRSRLPTYRLLMDEHKRLSDLAIAGQLTEAKAQLKTLSVPDSLLLYVINTEVPGAAAAAPDTLGEKAGLLTAYQNHYGIRPTGKLDSNTLRILQRSPDTVARLVRANLERLRWLPRQLEPEYVLVNIPLMELFYVENGVDALQMRVVVGRSSRQTPVLNAHMANVVFNPPWGVPPTILKKDVLPGISKRGGGYLARKGLKAYDAQGRVVDAGSINASNYRRYSYRQPPGPRNALGEIKFNMPNRWDIYLHDTPHREDFPRRDRALSSGCVRVQKPKEFAEFILAQKEGRAEFDPAKIDSLIELRKTRYENLKNRIPVHLVYLTAFDNADHNGVRYLGDIYKRDRRLMALLW